MPALVSALNSVDLPTLGRPTMPHLNPIHRPISLYVAASWLVQYRQLQEAL